MIAVFTWGFVSCETASFYTQAIKGQREIHRLARPLSEVKADPSTTSEVRRKLELVEEVRAFSIEHLGLRPTGQYTRYSDLKREHAVWVVFAAEEFSIDPYLWWYPMIGKVGYRGFFREAPAQELAVEMQAKGLEAYVGGVDAFSTLGWFKDPVLNTFINRQDYDVAEIIIHELTHHRLYIGHDTDFNEALATAFAEYGVKRWLQASGRYAESRRYQADSAAQRAFIELALQARQRLGTVYAETIDRPTVERRARKTEEISQFRRDALALQKRWPQLKGIPSWFDEPVTNARLNTIATYYQLVPAFERILEKHQNDPSAFFHEVEALGRLSKKKRMETLTQASSSEVR